MRRTITAVALGILLTCLCGAETKRAFTLKDLYRVKSVSEPSLSPDGENLLFTVGVSEMERGKRRSHIYLYTMKSGETRQVTFSEGSEFSPFWSPDGKTIFFLSTRKEGTQLWQMKLFGGEAVPLTSFPAGVSDPVISKDGSHILFQASVFPECGADGSCQKRMEKRLEEGPVQAHMADSLLYREWDTFREGTYNHLFLLNIKDASIVALTEGKTDYPTFQLSGGRGFDLSPEGKELCVSSKQVSNPAFSTDNDLYLVDLLSQKRKALKLTTENRGSDFSPRYSPNGEYIAYLTQRIDGYESDKIRLALYERKTGHHRVLTEKVDNWVESFQWAPDSKSLYFILQEGGKWPLYRVFVDGGKVEQVLETGAITSFIVSPNGRSLVFMRSSVGEPVELWSYRPGNKAETKRLTFFNKPLCDEVDIRPAEEVWVDGADGKKVQLFIVKPYNFDPVKKYPLILNVHGGPQSMWGDSFRGDWQVYPGAGYIVAFPNPHGSTGFGQAYTAAISGDYTGKVMEDIDKVTEYLAALPYVDSERMGAMGWSWGGYAMMWLEGHNKRFKAIASMMGIYDLPSFYGATEELWFPEWDLKGTPWENGEAYRLASPSSYVERFSTPALIITGERDYRVPYTQSLQFFTALQKRGVPSRLIVFKNDGHWPDNTASMPVYYNAHLEWFHTYLGGDPAPYETEKMVRNLQFEEAKTNAPTAFNYPDFSSRAIEPWTKQVQKLSSSLFLSMSQTEGNTRERKFSHQMDIKYAQPKYDVALRFENYYGKNKETTNLQKGKATLSFNRTLKDKLNYSSSATYEYDKITKLRYRINYGLGLSYEDRTKRVNTLAFSGTLAYERSRYDDGATLSQDSLRLIMRGKSSLSIQDNSKWETFLEYTPNMTCWEDFRIELRSSLRFLMKEPLWLKVSLMNQYNNSPATDGLKKNDITMVTGFELFI